MMTDEAPFRSDANETLRLARNLQALAFQSPELVARIRQTKDVAFPAAKNGEPTCRIQQGEVFRWVHSAYDPGDEARRQALALAGDSERVVCIGGGLGYLPIALLDNPARRVVLLEPELMFLRAMLSRFDCEEMLRTKRLLIVTASSIDAKHVAALGDGWDDVPHPVLGSLYEDRRRQLRFLSSVESAAARVLMVHSKLFTSDLASVFEKRGIAVRLVSASDLTIESFKAMLSESSPDFMFTVNFSPELALLCSRVKLPYLSWTIDPLSRSRLTVLDGTDLSLCVCFAHRKSIVQMFGNLGMMGATHLPLAAPSSRRRPIEDEERLRDYRCDVSFVGSSVRVDYQSMLRWVHHAGGNEADERRLESYVGELFDKRGRDIAFQGLREDGSELPPWLFESLGDHFSVEEASDRINGGLSHLLRMDRVLACHPLSIRVYGDDGWEGAKELYRGRAEHGDELTSIYNASTVNLDIPRIYQRDIITMRVFDTLLCGGLLLTEPTQDLLDLFSVGTHLLTYRDENEMRERISQMVADPSTARSIAEAGRRFVREGHTIHHRVQTMLEALVSRQLGGERLKQVVEQGDGLVLE